MNKRGIYLLVFVIILTSVYASKETDWLVSHYIGDRTIEEAALSLLAINKEIHSVNQLSSASAKLKTYLESCTNGNSCNNKDLALSLWALKESGDNSNILNTATPWLKIQEQ